MAFSAGRAKGQSGRLHFGFFGIKWMDVYIVTKISPKHLSAELQAIFAGGCNRVLENPEVSKAFQACFNK